MARDLAEATAEYRRAKQAVDDAKANVKSSQDSLRAARAVLAEFVVAETRAGTRMRDLVRITGLSREWLRTLLRQNGVYAED